MENLIESQQEFCGRIARTYDNLRKAGAARITWALLDLTMELLEKKWAKFEDQHERLCSEFGDQVKKNEYITSNVIGQVEEIYLQQRSALLEMKRTMSSTAADTSRLSTAETLKTRHSLPKIEMPTFSGNYEEWPEFRDLFSSMISRDGSISQVEKLHYLKVNLKGCAQH